MEHTVIPGQHAESKENEVRNVTIILSVLTIVELALGFIMYKVVQDDGFMRHLIKGIIVILMISKAYYIVSYFMHLGHEIRNLIMTIVVPLSLFVWFIIAFIYDGNSYRRNRMTYDAYKKERSHIQVQKTEHTEHQGTEGHKKPATME